MNTAIAYIRVSTDKQGKSGLGLEAQQAAIASYCRANGYEVVETFIEVETGKSASRPQLNAALAKGKKIGARLIFAKLDRLARNVDLLRSLINAKIDMVFCDMPNIAPGAMGKFMLTQMAAVAELEAGLIGERTKAALQAAKERGVKLGSPVAGQDKAAAARAFAESLRAELEPIMCRSSRQIAAHLNERGITTAEGGQWASAQVIRLVNRLNGETNAQVAA